MSEGVFSFIETITGEGLLDEFARLPLLDDALHTLEQHVGPVEAAAEPVYTGVDHETVFRDLHLHPVSHNAEPSPDELAEKLQHVYAVYDEQREAA